MVEKWKAVQGYEGHYDISTEGRARNIKSGRVMKPYFRRKYLSFGLSRNNKTKAFYIHILVAKAFIPNPMNKPCVNHKNGNKLDNRDTNLEWNTHSENSIHAYKTGLFARRKGRMQTNSKLTDEIVREVMKSNESASILGRKYSVSSRLILSIRQGKTWSHVTNLPKNSWSREEVKLIVLTALELEENQNIYENFDEWFDKNY